MRFNPTHDTSLSEIILNKDADTIVSEIRRAASGCQKVITKLTERDNVDPDRLVRFTSDIGRMLVAVTMLRDRLFSADQWIHKTHTRDPHIRRYVELNRLIAKAEETGNFSEEKRLRREYTVLVKMCGGTLDRLNLEIRTSCILRLDMIRYWQWFLCQSVDLYQFLLDSIAAKLSALREALPAEDELRACIEGVLSERSTIAITLPEPDPTMPDDLRELRRKIVTEIEHLGETQASLDKIREESRELENAEVLLKAEIDDLAPSAPETDANTVLVADLPVPSSRLQSRMAFLDRNR